MFSCEKFWKSILSYFQKISVKFSLTLAKNDWFYMILEKKFLPKGNIWVGRARKTGFSFFVA